MKILVILLAVLVSIGVTATLTALTVFFVQGVFHYHLPFWPTFAGIFVLGFLSRNSRSRS